MEQTTNTTTPSYPSFEDLFNKYKWEEIPNCPGRYVLESSMKRKLSTTTPTDFLEQKLTFQVFNSSVCKDIVHVTSFPSGGGIISYQRSNGTFLHTLNNSSGWNFLNKVEMMSRIEKKIESSSNRIKRFIEKYN